MMSESPAVQNAISIVRNRRTDAMFVCAYLAAVGLACVVIFVPDINQFAQGVVVTVLGLFIGVLKDMYSFENGTTRASQSKDATLAEIAKTVPALPPVPKVEP